MAAVKVLSLFSGAGGLDLGLERAGMEVVALCEIDPKARAVLRRHWPGTRIYDDVREVTRERLELDGIPHPDFVAGGSPCQDLSVAGKRRGLDGSRSGLFWEQCRIADEYGADILWENVPGALSSNLGADFAAVLWGITGALVELPDGQKWAKAGVLVGPKRTAIWRVADAQRFGVPQRRRRVYVVGCSGAVARGLAPLLLESQGGEGHRASGRETGTRAARTVADGSDDAGGPGAGRPDGRYGTDRTGVTGAAYSTGTGWWNDADGRAGTLRATGHPHEANLLSAEMRNGTVNADTVQTLLAHKNGWSVNDIPHVIHTSAFVKAKRASSNTDDDTWRDEPVSPTLNAFDNGGDTRATVLMVQPTEPTAFTPSGFATYQEGIGTLRARDAKGDTNVVVQDPVVFTQNQRGEVRDLAGVAGALLADSGAQGQNYVAHGTVVTALTANMAGAAGPCVDDAQGNRLIPVLLASEGDKEEPVPNTTWWDNGDTAPCLDASMLEKKQTMPERGRFAAVLQHADTFAFQPADQTLGKGALRAVRTDVAPTIALGDHHSDRGLRIVQSTGVTPVAFSAGNAAEAYGIGLSENIAPPLRAAASGSNQVPTVMYKDAAFEALGANGEDRVETPALVRMREGAPGGGKGPLVSENISLTLATGNDQVLFQPVAFTVKGNGEAWTQDMVTGITTGGGLPGQGYPAVIQSTGEGGD